VLGLENVDPDELDQARQIVLHAMQRKPRASEMYKSSVAELVFKAESKAAEIRRQGEPFEVWHSWLPKPTPYLRNLVRRSCGVDDLSDEAALVLLSEMPHQLGAKSPHEITHPWEQSERPKRRKGPLLKNTVYSFCHRCTSCQAYLCLYSVTGLGCTSPSPLDFCVRG